MPADSITDARRPADGAEAGRSPAALPGVLWLASYPKSGNTWLRALIANYMAGPLGPVPINALPSYAIGDNFLVHYERLSGRPAAQLTARDIARLRPLVHRWFATSRGQTALVKTHSRLARVDDEPLITADVTVGVVYVVRNPLDVAVSFARHYATTVERAVESLCREDNFLPGSDRLLPQMIGSWSQHVASWTGLEGLHRHVVRFEDLLERPKRTGRALVRFMELPVDPQRLGWALAWSSFDRLAAAERQHGFVEARPDGSTPFFREGRSGGWRAVLSEAQTRRICAAHAPLMRRFGYLDDAGRPC